MEQPTCRIVSVCCEVQIYSARWRLTIRIVDWKSIEISRVHRPRARLRTRWLPIIKMRSQMRWSCIRRCPIIVRSVANMRWSRKWSEIRIRSGIFSFPFLFLSQGSRQRRLSRSHRRSWKSSERLFPSSIRILVVKVVVSVWSASTEIGWIMDRIPRQLVVRITKAITRTQRRHVRTWIWVGSPPLVNVFTLHSAVREISRPFRTSSWPNQTVMSWKSRRWIVGVRCHVSRLRAIARNGPVRIGGPWP